MWSYSLTFDVKDDGSVPIARKIKEYPSWRMLADSKSHHFRLSPGYGPSAARVFDDAFRKVWAAGRDEPKKGSWVINLDELRIMSDKLGLRSHIETFYIAGRSRGITMIGSTQAPRYVPSEFYDQATWHIFGPVRDVKTLRRVGEIGGDTASIMDVVPQLDRERHEFYVLGPGFEAVTSYSKSKK